ncbi:MAG: hypothetical protein QM817_19950 [Archangium sp.]
MNRHALLLFVSLAACAPPPTATPPASLTAAAVIPPRPTDVTRPLDAVMWTFNYDLREFDSVWRWLRDDVPASPERSRAIAAATTIGVVELERTDLTAVGMPAFDEAIAGYPGDARLPVWKAYIRYLDARASGDRSRIEATIDELRTASGTYKAFTLFGLTLAIGGWADASPTQIEEARDAFKEVVRDTALFQHATDPVSVDRSRRIWDSPIAPYNIPAMQAMIGDLALRAGKPDEAVVSYYTAINSNAGARWPWRAEAQRRMQNAQQVAEELNARPAQTYAFGSTGVGALGITTKQVDTRFGGRIGNGSCTVCHTHVSIFDEGGTIEPIGWIKGRIAKSKDVPNLQPIAFALPDGANPIPGGFGLGPYVDTAESRDFMQRSELFDGTFVIPAKPGRYFVATQADVDGVTWQGYLPNGVGAQWFFEVKAGEMVDVSSVAIEMKPK